MEDVIATDELRKNLGANVIRLRRARGLTQEQLAKEVELSRVQLNRIENGHNSPSAEILYALADALGVTADALRQISS